MICTNCGKPHNGKYKTLCNNCYMREYQRRKRLANPQERKRTQNKVAGYIIHYDVKPSGYCPHCTSLDKRRSYPTSKTNGCWKCYCRYELGRRGYDEVLSF